MHPSPYINVCVRDQSERERGLDIPPLPTSLVFSFYIDHHRHQIPTNPPFAVQPSLPLALVAHTHIYILTHYLLFLFSFFLAYIFCLLTFDS